MEAVVTQVTQELYINNLYIHVKRNFAPTLLFLYHCMF